MADARDHSSNPGVGRRRALLGAVGTLGAGCTESTGPSPTSGLSLSHSISSTATPSQTFTGSASQALTINPEEPGIRYSSFSWRAAGGERRGNAGAMVTAMIRSGRVGVRISSPGAVAYRLNGSAWNYAAGSGLLELPTQGDAVWPTNLVEVVLVDMWGTFAGFEIESRGTLLPLSGPGGPRIFALGDSITLGQGVGPDGTPHPTNALFAYPAALRDLLGADVGISASGGRGWMTNDPLRETWDSVDNQPMAWSDRPDAIVIMAGGGEPDDPALASAVDATLGDMLATLPETHILVLGHTNAASPAVTTINAAVQRFRDPRVHFVNAAPWTDGEGYTTDGIHHAGWVGRGVMAPRVAAELRRILKVL